jgi:CheY-like chemotaxis protein
VATHDVLVIEDDRDIRDLLVGALRVEGFEVLPAEDGASALAMLRGGARPRLVLLDLMMPGMNGWQLWEEFAQDPELAAIPVVVISGAGEAARSTGTRGVAGSLVKPFDLDLLLETVARFVP